MRIAFVLPGFSAHADDWAIPALQTLLTYQAQMHQVTVFSLRYPDRGIYNFGRIGHIALGGGQRFGLFAPKLWLEAVGRIIREHRREPFDLLHAFWADEPGLVAVLAGAIIRRPVVVSLGGWELTDRPAIEYGAQRHLTRRLMVRFALAAAQQVTAGSPYQVDLGRAYGLPESRLDFAPLGVDTAHFQTGPPALFPPKLVQAASLVAVKNQALLLETLRQVSDRLPDIQLHLAGRGPLQPRLEALAQSLGVADKVVWQPYPHQDMPTLYRQAHLYVQTSHHESQGMSVLEGMACGVPVIGTPVGVVREVACLPPSESASVLATQAVDLLQDRERLAAFGHAAREIVDRDYSLAVSVRAFNKIYDFCR